MSDVDRLKENLAWLRAGLPGHRHYLGCTWMTSVEAREAIPPAYTRFIGEQFLAQKVVA